MATSYNKIVIGFFLILFLPMHKLLATTIIVDNGNAGYTEHAVGGAWALSGLTGYNGTSTRYLGGTGTGYVEWQPTITQSGLYRISIYKVGSTDYNESLNVSVNYSGGNFERNNVNVNVLPTGWFSVGLFQLDSAGVHRIRLSRDHTGSNLRADAVKFELISPTVLHVSPTGNDLSGNGSYGNPYATLDKVRQVIRTLNSSMSSDIVVYFRGGVYPISTTVNFDYLDSGSNGYKIRYANYPGENPVFSGGTTTGSWSVFSGNIYRTFVGTGVDFRQLYINEAKGIRARKPNVGADYVFSTERQTNGFDIDPAQLSGVTVDSNQIEIAAECVWMHKRFRIKSVAAAGAYTRAVVNPIEWDDMLNKPQGTRGYQNKNYFLENAIEFLDSPGEWFLNKQTGYLYYWPRPGENLATANVTYPSVNDRIISVNGTLTNMVHDLEFSGITFQFTNWTRPNLYGLVDVQANTLIPSPPNDNTDTQYRHDQKKDRIEAALNITSANNVVVSGCTFMHLGGNGLTFNNGGSNISIIGNRFVDLAGSGIEVGNDADTPVDAKMFPNNIQITNNYIGDIANDYYGGTGITTFYVNALSIEHNYIRDIPYTAISAGWGWGESEAVASNKNYVIKNNRVENALRKLHDGGMIYTPNPIMGSYNVLDGNYLKGNASLTDTTKFYSGIYHDGCSAYWLDQNNVIEDVAAAIILQDNKTTQISHNNVINYNYVSRTSLIGIQNRGTNNTVTNTQLYYDETYRDTNASLIVAESGLDSAFAHLSVRPVEVSASPAIILDTLGATRLISVTLSNNTGNTLTNVLVSFSVPAELAMDTVSKYVTLLNGQIKTVTFHITIPVSWNENRITVPFLVSHSAMATYIGNVGVSTRNVEKIVTVKDTPEYSESGTWTNSGITGYNKILSRYPTGGSPVFAKWTPALPTSGRYKVAIYKVFHASGTTQANVETVDNTGVSSFDSMNQASGTSGWYHLGVFHFNSGGSSGYVKLTNGLPTGTLRSSAVKFIYLGP